MTQKLPRTPKLRASILDHLEADGCKCLDDANDREALARDLSAMLSRKMRATIKRTLAGDICSAQALDVPADRARVARALTQALGL